MTFLRDLPEGLASDLEGIWTVGDLALAEQRWADAFTSFENSYRLMLDGQPPDGRFHKGAPLHNMGLTRYFLRNPAEGARYTLWAFIEDAVSRAEESPEVMDELERPAAQNLLFVFGVPIPSLINYSRAVRTRFQEAPTILRDPRRAAAYFAAHGVTMTFQTATPPTERQIGEGSTGWHERVFVGGSYGTHLPNINEIAAAVTARGFDAIMPKDFSIPPDLIHHHSLMLLHTCQYAIFEMSEDAGQLMELERCRDYGITPLVVYSGTAVHGHVSMMVSTLLARLDLEAKPYSTMEELRNLVDEYLPSGPVSP